MPCVDQVPDWGQAAGGRRQAAGGAKCKLQVGPATRCARHHPQKYPSELLTYLAYLRKQPFFHSLVRWDKAAKLST